MLSVKRHQQYLSSLTATTLKVYNCVPMSEYWPASAIHAELMRLGVGMSVQMSSGCLDSLCRTGLIKETREGFMRVPVREKMGLADLKDVLPQPEPEPEPKEVPMTQVSPITKPAAAPKSVVDILASLSQQIAATTLRHQQEMKTLADLVADAAIDVQAEFEKKDEALAKWNQMQAILKGMAA